MVTEQVNLLNINFITVIQEVQFSSQMSRFVVDLSTIRAKNYFNKVYYEKPFAQLSMMKFVYFNKGKRLLLPRLSILLNIIKGVL